MKKSKELLWFLIPFVLLSVATIFSTLGDWIANTPTLIGVTDYVGLYIDTPRFWLYVLKTLVLGWLFCAVLAVVLIWIVRRLHLSRWMQYVAIFVGAIVITAGLWMVGMQLLPRWYNLLNFVKYGNAAAFFAWLAERIWLKKKSTETGV